MHVTGYKQLGKVRSCENSVKLIFDGVERQVHSPSELQKTNSKMQTDKYLSYVSRDQFFLLLCLELWLNYRVENT
jgi:hypothetical protein